MTTRDDLTFDGLLQRFPRIEEGLIGLYEHQLDELVMRYGRLDLETRTRIEQVALLVNVDQMLPRLTMARAIQFVVFGLYRPITGTRSEYEIGEGGNRHIVTITDTTHQCTCDFFQRVWGSLQKRHICPHVMGLMMQGLAPIPAR